VICLVIIAAHLTSTRFGFTAPVYELQCSLLHLMP
jgi:hypothetical protein